MQYEIYDKGGGLMKKKKAKFRALDGRTER